MSVVLAKECSERVINRKSLVVGIQDVFFLYNNILKITSDLFLTFKDNHNLLLSFFDNKCLFYYYLINIEIISVFFKIIRSHNNMLFVRS